MTPQEAIEILEVNVICSPKATKFKEGVEVAKKALEKQIPKKPYSDNDNGIYEKEYCPNCHRSLFSNDHHCRCGQALDWR